MMNTLETSRDCWIVNMFYKINKERFNKLSVILLCIILCMYLYYIVNTNLFIGKYGLMTSLNWVFFSLLYFNIIILLLNIYKKNYFSTIFATVILFIIIFITPLLLEGNPRFTFSYLVYGHTKFILNTAHIEGQLFTYQQWPGLMVLGSIIIQITSYEGHMMIAVFQIILKIISLVIIFTLMMTMGIEKNYSFFGLLLFILIDWTSHMYYTPPALGTLFFIIIVLIVFLSIFKELDRQKTFIMIILLFTALTISHGLSSILALIFFGGVISILIIYYRYDVNYKYLLIKNTNLVIIPLIILTFWTFFVIGDFTHANLNSYITNIFNIFSIVEATEKSINPSGNLYKDILFIKLSYTILIILISIPCLIYVINKFKTPNLHYSLPFISLITAAVVLPLIVGPYGGEIISRAFGYCTPFLIILMLLVKNKKYYTILIIFILISPAPLMISLYGNEQMDYVSTSELSGINHYYENYNYSIITISGGRAWLMNNIEKMVIQNLNFGNSTDFVKNNSGNIVLSQRSIESYEFTYGKLEYNNLLCNLNSDYYIKTYNSKAFTIYTFNPTSTLDSEKIH